MNRFSSFLLAAAVLFLFTQCDDTTGTVGSTIVPDKDIITAKTDTCHAISRTIMANDSILANTSDVYLGQYTDEESGTIFNSSFITQFGCSENFIFPEEGVVNNCATYTTLRLYFNEYYGDSLNAMTCEIYELDNTLVEGKPYYTNLTPEDFYETGKKPLASKTFNVVDFTQHDTILNSDNYTRHIEIPLPNDIGNRFIEKFYETDSEGNNVGKQYFANSEVFINEIFKGIYVKCSHGDGTVLKVYRTRLDIGFERKIKKTDGTDSIQPLSAPFYSGKEVLQTNKFDNKGLQALADERMHTYIKTPAGLYTEVTLPVVETIENCNIINTAKIEFTRYNESTTPPTRLLMVRKSELYRFFLKNDIADGNTSFLSAFSSSTNKYTFSNIANLIRYCYNEYNEGIKNDSEWETKNPDWNKVVLIPVNITTDSNDNVVKVTHNTDQTSVKLRGGESYKIPIEVISSKFND